MTNQQTQVMDNPLCRKLQREFRGRGVNAPGFASSVSTHEVMRRVANGFDPYEDAAPTSVYRPEATVAMPVVRQQAAAHTAPAAAPRYRAAEGAMPVAPATAPLRKRTVDNGRKIRPLDYIEKTSGRMKSRTFEAIRNRGFVLPENIRVPGYTRAYTSAARVRTTAVKYEREREMQMNAEEGGIYGLPVIGGALEILSDACHWVLDSCKSLYRRLSGQVAEERISSARRSIPVGAITLGVVFAVILFVVIYSCAEANEVKRDVSAMQQRQEELIAMQNELEIELELRDDIRVIREIATEELGMVSSDAVDSRFVSVAGNGTEIELPEESKTDDSHKSGTLFSALQSWANEIKYYFH